MQTSTSKQQSQNQKQNVKQSQRNNKQHNLKEHQQLSSSIQVQHDDVQLVELKDKVYNLTQQKNALTQRNAQIQSQYKKLKIFMVLIFIITVFIFVIYVKIIQFQFQQQNNRTSLIFQQLKHNQNITTYAHRQNIALKSQIQEVEKQNSLNLQQIKNLKKLIIKGMIKPHIIQADKIQKKQKQHLQSLQKARQLLKEINQRDSILYFQVMQKIGQFFLHNEQYGFYIDINKLLKQFLKAKNQTKTHKYSQILNEIGYGHLQLKQFDESLNYLLQSLNVSYINEAVSLQRGKVLNNIGHAYLKKAEYQKAWDYFNKGLIQMVKLRNSPSNYQEPAFVVDTWVINIKESMQKVQNKMKTKDQAL